MLGGPICCSVLLKPLMYYSSYKELCYVVPLSINVREDLYIHWVLCRTWVIFGVFSQLDCNFVEIGKMSCSGIKSYYCFSVGLLHMLDETINEFIGKWNVLNQNIFFALVKQDEEAGPFRS